MPGLAKMEAAMNNPLTHLHCLIVERYSLSELQTLCFDLGINYDDLPGEALSDKARELILRMGRRRQLEQLLNGIVRTRPDLSDDIVVKTDPAVLYNALHTFSGTEQRTRGTRSILFALLAIAVVVAGAVIILISQGASEPPHAPPIENTFGTQLFDEQLLVLSVASGEEKVLRVMDLWSAPEGMPADCATAFLAFTWQVRDPYPKGGEDLEFRRVIPMGDGRTEAFAGGATGSSSIGYCDEITVFNTSLVDYRVEIRYASGSHE
jgi:hypothetical protein